jgi:stearoyl-CoA desaturase (delta-9 desaturase)
MGEPLARPSTVSQVASLAAVVLPLLGLVAAIVLLWGTGIEWIHLVLLVGGYVLTALGITVGYHRLFTHKSFRTNAAMKILWGALGSMAVEGPVLTWVATHRRHHQHSDRDEDPHTPHGKGDGWLAAIKGAYHAHIGWFFAIGPTEVDLARYVPDLRADPVVRFVSRLFPLWVALGVIIPGAIAFAVTGTWMGALLGVIWGGLLRVFLVHHVTWSINSVCHLWGTQPSGTHDHSRNNAIFGVLALGEGWHNNHHAFPTSARHGLEWWQLDVGWIVIRTMGWLGLANGIKVPARDRIIAKRRAD